MKKWAKAVGEPDMTALKEISVEAIAENLKERFKAGIIYVSNFHFECSVFNFLSTTKRLYCYLSLIFFGMFTNILN